MATGKDQPQTIVRDFIDREIRRFDYRFRSEVGVSGEFFLQTRLTPQAVDGFVFGGLDDPGAWRLRDTFSAPLIDGGGEGLLCGVFGEFKIAKLTY